MRARCRVFKHKGEYLVLEPGRRIVQTFVWAGEASDSTGEYWDELVTVTFRAIEPRLTGVTLTNGWNGKSMTDAEKERFGEGWGDWLNRSSGRFWAEATSG